MFEQENVDGKTVATVGIFGAALIFVAIVSIQVLFLRLEKADDGVKNRTQPRAIAQVHSEQMAQTSSYHWVDKQEGIVAIPLDKAMELTVQALKGQTQ